MPSFTVLTEDKAVIRRALPSSTTRIFMATVARLYVAYPDPNRWTYSNVMGALVFVRDEMKNSFFLRIVDLRTGRGVIWEQELYQEFNYQADRPFFHTFAADNYTAGFSFADEMEADILYQKVIGRDELLRTKVQTAVPGPVAATPQRSSGWFGNKSTSKKKDRPKVDKARIGLPSNFQHLGHIGWDAEKGFNVEKIPPDWRNLFESAGVTEDQLKDEETAKFVYNFVQSRGGPKSIEKPPAAPPARPQRAPPPATAPPPPPAGAARRPPPPPPRHRNAGQGPVPNGNSMPQHAVSEPTPIPVPQTLNQSSAPPMPARSPSPVRTNVLPPSQPSVSAMAPPAAGGAPPPPPPPPPPASFPSTAAPVPPSIVQPIAPRSTPVGGDRFDLLASIRSAGVSSLKPATSREPTSPPSEEASAGGDLASALASALAARSKAITTDSDDEEEDDDDWD